MLEVARRIRDQANHVAVELAIETLGRERLDVIHAGEHSFHLRERIRALAFTRADEDSSSCD